MKESFILNHALNKISIISETTTIFILGLTQTLIFLNHISLNKLQKNLTKKVFKFLND